MPITNLSPLHYAVRELANLVSQLYCLLRLHEAQREAVARSALVTRVLGRGVPVALVLGVAQERTLGVELEARGEDLLLHDLLVDTVKRLAVLRTRACNRAVIDDAVH